MNKLNLLELIEAKNMLGEFLEIVENIKQGKIIQDDDELYAEGFWDFTFYLGLNCDTGIDEKQFVETYYNLWELADFILAKEGK